ncbi:MAG: glucosaminidase domain-containing protein [Bacteroidaceae bacterium]|nr:glucosaminidase domain-containing protein [Bacteroidaceae bacterium]
MKVYKIFLLAAALFLMGCVSHGKMANSSYPTGDDYSRYVQAYHPVAVEQMEKYGIPASITLAQGLLESGAGKSELARKSNNHFGIKADKSWEGKSVSSMDNGRLCKFRKYNDVGDSYEDHSRFLVDRERYAFLFKLRRTDYEGWAEGLKKAGYAEDSQYPQKLINLIERYGLYRYDNYGAVGNGRVVYSTNGVPYIVAENGDNFRTIAKEIGVSARKLRKYNDIRNKREPVPGEKIFTKKKKGKAAKGTEFHTTANGESLYTISQKYGIRLMKLYDLNPQYRSYTKLKVGDIIRLR